LAIATDSQAHLGRRKKEGRRKEEKRRKKEEDC
jgi:hypothetical protein